MLPAVSDLSWVIVGTADFDRNSTADILWRNLVTGQNAIFLMDGLKVIKFDLLPAQPDLNWVVVGTSG